MTKIGKKTAEMMSLEPTLQERKIAIIKKFVKPEKIDWPRSMRELNNLLKKNEIEVFEFIVLGFNLNTLTFFNKGQGLLEIEKAKKIIANLKVKKSEPVNFDKKEYCRLTTKKQTILDQLK